MTLRCPRDCTMRHALEDPDIFGSILAGPSWASWRVILIASQGEPLTDDERAIFTALTGREFEPAEPVDELWGIVGRRGGKTRAFAVLAAFYAALVDYSAVQAPGERIKIPLLASTTTQAAKAFSYIKGIFEAVPDLAAMVDGEPTAETIRLRTGVDIEIRPANFRTIRGETIGAAFCDELAYWRIEGSANPDTEILDAVRPGLATTGGPLCVLSSPYARKGELYRTHERDYGPNGSPAVLVMRAPSRTMNPDLDPKVVEAAYRRDPAAASAEYGAEFRKDVEAFIQLETIQACMSGDFTERPPAAGIKYAAFVDPSGGGADSMTLAIGHRDGDDVYLDCVREMHPGKEPDAVVVEFAAVLKSYGVSRVTGDRFAGEWPRERFRKNGITYDISERSKSDLYREFLPILNSRRAYLLPVPKLEGQLSSLERRTSRGTGRDIIDHPQVKGAHDDVANVVAGVCVILATKQSTLQIWCALGRD